MKKIYALAFCLCAFGFSKAQITNSSFENWQTDTTTFSFGTFVPLDTFSYTTPVGWTCLNAISMSPGLGSVQLVDSSPYAFSGNKSLYMYTDTINLNSLGFHLILPGFVVNGNFPLLISAFYGNSHLTPLIFAGAGIPFTQRLQSFGFYMKYLPVPNDSCLMWAMLKKGSEVVADARFSTTQTYNNFTYIEQNFTYYTCDVPDTLVILMSTSTPDLGTLGGGHSGLTAGSQIWLDSVGITPITGNYTITPVASNISESVPEDIPRSIPVITNATDCQGNHLNASIAAGPGHGTAVVDSLQNIVYTPNTGFTGNDTMTYSISNGVNQAVGTIFINVYTVTTTCDTMFMEHCYNWSYNFIHKESCVSASGIVQLILPPTTTQDGDAHIYILPDSAYTGLVYSPSQYPTWLNVEEVCVGTPIDSIGPYCDNWTDPLYFPNVGEHVMLTGPWVFDNSHGWNEIHPVCSMELVGASYVPDLNNSFLNDFKVFPQPANGQVSLLFSHAPHQTTFIRFYNAQGRDVGIYGMAETELLNLNTSYWPAGMYFYSIVQQGSVLKSGKMLVVH